MATNSISRPKPSIFKAPFRLFDIIINGIRGTKNDYFLYHKYTGIKEYYGKDCLDIGSGRGFYSEFLHEHGHSVTSIDVIDLSEDDIDHNFSIFDGKNIPFEDKSFDTSMLLFVLHHTDYQEELIKDCIRVTKGHIIIGEDIIENRLDRILGNIHLNTAAWSKGSDAFKSHDKWLEFFERHNLELVATMPIVWTEFPTYPVSRKIYVLKVR